jgi:hypothetical protein
MAKDIDLTWDITPMAGQTDIDSLEIFQKLGDHTAEADMAVFRTGATSVDTPAKNATNYTHMGVAAGTYTYGVFSKNQGGYGPGDLINTALVVL